MKLCGGRALPRARRLVFEEVHRSICFCGRAARTVAPLVFVPKSTKMSCSGGFFSSLTAAAAICDILETPAEDSFVEQIK